MEVRVDAYHMSAFRGSRHSGDTPTLLTNTMPIVDYFYNQPGAPISDTFANHCQERCILELKTKFHRVLLIAPPHVAGSSADLADSRLNILLSAKMRILIVRTFCLSLGLQEQIIKI
jgi:hypothetical protein